MENFEKNISREEGGNCRSGHELSNAYLVAKIGLDTAENEPSKVSTLPYPTLPYPTLPYPTLPYPTLPSGRRGARPYGEDAYALLGRSPLHCAAARGHTATVRR